MELAKIYKPRNYVYLKKIQSDGGNYTYGGEFGLRNLIGD